MSQSYLLVALPELFLLAAGLVLLVVGAFKETAAGARLVSNLALGTLAITLVLVLVAAPDRAVAFRGNFVMDGFAGFMKVVVLLGALGTLAIAQPYLRREGIERFEYAVLVIFSTAGMSLLLSANSFLALYISLELMSLPLYVLAAFQRDTYKSTEAGLKYFVLGALASGMLLYGVSLVYGFTGTIFFEELTALYLDEEGAELPLGALVGVVFIAAGLAFKLGAVPFHMWTPDVYEGAPTAVTALFAAAPKLAAMGLTVRVFAEPFGAFVADWQQIIIAVSVGSMVLGAFGAIGQRNIKRLLAYSGIGHVGYALVGLAAGTQSGVYGVLVYMTIYLFMTVGTFGVVLALRRRGQSLEQIDDFAGLGKDQPLLALATAIFMFSLAGIPPLAGFFGKLYVFLAAIEVGLVWLAVIGVLTSVVGAYYYLRIVKLVYFDSAPEALDRGMEPELRGVIAVSAVVTALFVVVPGPILGSARVAAGALFP
ncbi:MAG: NADH-quinone oxidoreductase subunit NuoN [Alphaproteobacteria bacterium]|jgi:NADH-quinone oxidoreductase subunit N|nr:NADH-quinone oxidoreductase subunit NuoN [Alphaproteobacteria bacterium]